MKKYNAIIFWVSLFAVVSCNKAEWDEEVPLNIKVQSDIDQPIEINNYTISVDDIHLTISSIRIHGERLQANDVDKVFSDNINLDFSNPESVNYKIDLPVGTYEKLEVSVEFDTVTSTPLFSGEIEGVGNQPFQSSIDIPLNFTKVENITIKNQNNDNIILIDENTGSIEIIFSGQDSFNDINYGIFNALMNTNQGESEVDLNSVVGAHFLEDFNSSFISTLQIKIHN